MGYFYAKKSFCKIQPDPVKGLKILKVQESQEKTKICLIWKVKKPRSPIPVRYMPKLVLKNRIRINLVFIEPNPVAMERTIYRFALILVANFQNWIRITTER